MYEMLLFQVVSGSMKSAKSIGDNGDTSTSISV